MRMIPSYLSSELGNRGERLLYEQLADFRDDSYIAVHSLNLPAHAYKATGEIDFVILGPQGLYVLEVKGGQISRNEGIWVYQDRWMDQRRSSEGPFRQASSAMYALRERLESSIDPYELDELTIGYGVVFPDCEFDVQSVEWDQQLILDASKWGKIGIENYLRELERYWHQKFPNKTDNLGENVIGNILSALRPDFELVRSLQVETTAIEARLVSMTEEQYYRIDIIGHYPRILIEGGAGTGKTFIANELSKRYGREGKSVLFLCFSPLLAGYLNKQNKESNVSVTSIHQLMLDLAAKYKKIPRGYYPGMSVIDNWYLNELAPVFEEATKSFNDTDRFDVIIVDEAQDIMNMNYLAAMDQMLKGGIENGTWRIFIDPCNQGAIFGNIEDETIELLRSFGPVIPRLKVNCRNTNEIVMQTKLITGADLSNKSTGPGPEVIIEYPKNELEAARLIEAYLDNLAKQNCLDSKITILSPLHFNQSCVQKLGKQWKDRIFPMRGTTSETFPHSKITYATIADFKGLENRNILLVDFDQINTNPEVQANLYVGMTRARVRLWMCFYEGLKDEVKAVIFQNLQYLSEEYSNEH